MEAAAVERLKRRAWGLAVTAAFLFALGGVATWAQETWVRIPVRLASALVLLGLVASVASLLHAMRALFAGVVLTARQHGTLLGSMLLAALPPAGFLAWLAWIRWS